MEKKTSVTSHMKNFKISYVSPVKQFDHDHESTPVTKGSKGLKNINILNGSKVTELLTTVNKQHTEIKQLKNVIAVKDEKLGKDKLKLERAIHLLQECYQGRNDMCEVKQFLHDCSNKRKASDEADELEAVNKKRKVMETDDQKLSSFDKNELDLNIGNRKRKLETPEDIDISFLLKRPSKIQEEKERKLDQIDEEIKEDQENLIKLQDKWDSDNKKLKEFLESQSNEKQTAAKNKARLRTEISHESISKMTEGNIDFLTKIIDGELPNPKHSLFFDKCGFKAQSLLYETVNEPFSEGQVDAAYEVVNREFRSLPNMDQNYIGETIIKSLR